MAGPLPEPETMKQYEGIQLEARAREVRLANIEVILRLYVVLGLFIAVVSLAYFGFSFLKITLTDEQRVTLVAAGTGLSVAVMSAAYLMFRRRQISFAGEEYEIARLDYDLIREWNKFEAMGRKVLQERGIDFNPKSPRSILTSLQSNDLIPNDLAREISTALDIRNRVVHHVEPQPQILVQAAGRILAESNEKLNRLLAVPDQNQILETGGVMVFGDGNTTGPHSAGGGTAVSGDSPSLNLLRKGKRPLSPDDE